VTPAVKRILVVEDDAEIRRSLAEILGEVGYEVDVAANGKEALAVLETWLPSVILLDLMMPVMDGWTLRAELDKRDAALRDIPVIVVTADANAREKAAEVRADAWLRKPVRLERLLELIDELAA
jgi:CheY-like chemotaxis protein